MLTAKPESSYQVHPMMEGPSAELGVKTLRQACCQEIPGSAMCVQNFDDSRGLAIRITYRISLRSSSLWEPRHPLLKVVNNKKGSATSVQNHQQPLLSFRYSVISGDELGLASWSIQATQVFRGYKKQAPHQVEGQVHGG